MPEDQGYDALSLDVNKSSTESPELRRQISLVTGLPRGAATEPIKDLTPSFAMYGATVFVVAAASAGLTAYAIKKGLM